MNWEQQVINDFLTQISQDKALKKYVSKFSDTNSAKVHLAIFSEPFLSKLIDGTKIIESRFSKRKISPHGDLNKGDIVLVKKSGGQISGFFIAGKIIRYSNLNDKKREEIREKYGHDICSFLDPDFWQKRKECKYATLARVSNYYPISPIDDNKKDRRGWVILNEKSLRLHF